MKIIFKSSLVYKSIIIVLAAFLISTLIFTYQQNKLYSAKPTESARPFVLIDWGLIFKTSSGFDVDQLTYYKVNNDYWGEIFILSTKRVEALGGDCAEPSNGTKPTVGLVELIKTEKPITKIEPNTELSNAPVFAKKLDGFYSEYVYYYVRGTQKYCSTNGTDIQIQDRAMIVNLLMDVDYFIQA